MEIAPKIMNARVMHKRLIPKVNQFNYGVYYIVLPISQLSEAHKMPQQKALYSCLPRNYFSWMSFYDCDHGPKNGEDIHSWIYGILTEYHLEDTVDEVLLVTMPRILGYVFNPVSFWLCLDKGGQLRAVLAQVNNTFSQTHNYLCFRDDRQPIASDEWLCAEKIFHVSPFLERNGGYQFRFDFSDKGLGIEIDYYDNEGQKQLVTMLNGSFVPLNKAQMRRAFWRHPLVTFKTILLIHWQALKIITKGVAYIPKPKQRSVRISCASNIKKM